MLLLPFLSFNLVIFVSFVAAQYFSEDIPYFIYCSGDNFTSPSQYEYNLHLLLRGLVKWPDRWPLYRRIVSGNSPTLEVFGLAQCRPQISIDVCNECLNHTASVIIADSSGNCGRRRSTIVRFDLCVLRYSDHRFYGIPEQNPFRFIPTNSSIVTTIDTATVARYQLRSVLPDAATDDSRFVERIANDSVGRLIIITAWCTMDLISSDCLQCLRRAEESFPDGNSWGIATSLSCEVRLLTESFGNRLSPSPLSPLFVSNPAVPIPQPWPRKEGKKMEEEILGAMKSTVLDLGAIRAATNNFAEENMSGHCGFAVMYKGVLQHGQEIAVKRLSRTSEQGLLEMENEVNLVTKLQHKNLVRLLGYFLAEEEKLLVYDYLPNSSLAKFLYDPVKRSLLDWGTRFKIIVGISRGLLYLHEDSLHRIVHCNLNASNILLDSTMEPKISEFGFAKLFSVDETERYVSQIVGNFEYMAPEIADHGLFSTKSDVFRVLVLEIVTGQRIGSINNGELLRNVRKQWREGMAWKVIDKSMGAEYSSKEAFKCIEIGLLCLQENHRDRPNMALLVAMLGTL